MRNPSPPRSRSVARQARASRARRVGLERLEGRELLTAVGVPEGLVSWWTADGTPADLKGLNNATLYSGTTYATGEVGQAFRLDGVDDRVQVADSDSLKLTESLTIEGWVRVDSFTPNNGGVIFFRGDDRGGLDPYQLSVQADGNLLFLVNDASNAGASVKAPIALGQKIHVAATLDDATGEMRLYENGELVRRTTTPIRPFRDLDPASNPSIGIGNHGGYPTTPHNFPFNGLIDELSVYDRALTAFEVGGIYNAGSAGKIRAANYFAADFPSVTEGPAGTATSVTFTLRRVGSLAGSASVDWATGDGTATAGSDYVSAAGHLDFADGESQKTVQVNVNGDSLAETDETFWLNLSTSTPGYSGGGGLATILDDDPTVSVDDVQVAEGDPRFGSLGALVSQAGSGGLNRTTGMAFGPDGDLYVGSLNTNEVLRYSPTGAFLGAFVTAGNGGLDGPAVDGLAFRNNLLYVASRNSSSVLRYDAATGAFVDTFVAPGSGGLLEPKGMEFAPDGSLLLSSGTNEVLRYSGTTGAFLGALVPAGSGGLSNPRSLTYGADGNLYASSTGSNAVLKYNGSTGAYLSTLIPSGSGGLSSPGDLLFSGGRLYVASAGTGQILRYDATTGAFIDDAVPAGSDGLDRPIGLVLEPGQSLLVGGFAEVIRYVAPFPASFTVRLNHAVPTTVTVDYATAVGTAQSGTDFTAVAGTLTFAPGETTKTVRVAIVNDVIGEPTEAFVLNLSNPVGATIADGQGVGTILDDDATKFYVVNDAATDRTYEYGAFGASVEDYAINSGNTAPRGAASTAAGDRVWVADANKKVYVYGTGGALLGSWSAGGLPSNAAVEGITVFGADVWIVDGKSDKVFKYAGAAGLTSGSKNATSSFSLYTSQNNPNVNAKDLVTDGTAFWVVDDNASGKVAKIPKVFKYSMTGTFLETWGIGAGVTSPTGITLDPTGGDALWILDAGTRRVYQFDHGRSGSSSMSRSFALAAGNTNPQGIADPPMPTLGVPVAGADSGSSRASAAPLVHHGETIPTPPIAKLSRSPLPPAVAVNSGREVTPVLMPPMSLSDQDLTLLASESARAGRRRAGTAHRG